MKERSGLGPSTAPHSHQTVPSKPISNTFLIIGNILDLTVEKKRKVFISIQQWSSNERCVVGCGLLQHLATLERMTGSSSKLIESQLSSAAFAVLEP